MTFYSKILLFGEYTIIKGGQALAVPFSKYQGVFDFIKEEQSRDLQQNLYDFYRYLKTLQDKQELLVTFDLNQFEADLDQGIYFNSNIPTGYGVGSSGALCAALLERYAVSEVTLSLEEQKVLFAKLESFFHGTSSGVDPLICYNNSPILIAGSRLSKVAIELEKNPFTIFLVDTNKRRSTGPLVKLFFEKCKKETYSNALTTELTPTVDQAIQALLQQQWEALYAHWSTISTLQWQYFQEMIPEDCKHIWEEGLNTNEYKLKLCGAGGGGFLLGITKNYDDLENKIKNFKTIKY